MSKRMLQVVVGFAALIVGLGGCASQATRIKLQQPPQPTARAFEIPFNHRLKNAVVIDYVSGMSQHSYFFAEANQSAFRPMLQQVLERSGMAARTPLAGRYGLQVEFQDLRGSFFGTDFDSRSRAVYRIVERATGQVVFEDVVDAGFKARYVGLVEEDFAAAYWLTLGVAAVGLGQVVEVDALSRPHAVALFPFRGRVGLGSGGYFGCSYRMFSSLSGGGGPDPARGRRDHGDHSRLEPPTRRIGAG